MSKNSLSYLCPGFQIHSGVGVCHYPEKAAKIQTLQPKILTVAGVPGATVPKQQAFHAIRASLADYGTEKARIRGDTGFHKLAAGL